MLNAQRPSLPSDISSGARAFRMDAFCQLLDSHVWLSIDKESAGQTDQPDHLVQCEHHYAKTDSREKDKWPLRRCPQVGHGIEVTSCTVLSQRLWRGLVAGAHIEEEVCLPAKQLMKNESSQHVQRSVIGMSQCVRNFCHNGNFASPARHKCGILFHVASVAMMACVGVLPGKVWYQENGVEYESEGIVQEVG